MDYNPVETQPVPISEKNYDRDSVFQHSCCWKTEGEHGCPLVL